MSAFKRPSSSVNGDLQANKKPHTEIKTTSELPICLKKLIACVIRTFYSCEHALVMNLLMRNTIMKEDDLSERIKLDKKQLRQLLHTLKSEQFIKSKMQLETDVNEGKSVRITHYFIDYKLFVNIVKYKLDVIQRKLETEQRESSSRASFRCTQCRTPYTDLEIDRLFNMALGKLVCTYCRADVSEEEQASPRSDACALVARFNQQVRAPLDILLKECDGIHLSSALLEPQIKPLEPLPGSKDYNPNNGLIWDEEREKRWEQNSNLPSDTTIKIVLDSHQGSNFSAVKERPIWMVESTIKQDPLPKPSDNLTQTLVPGRVPSAHGDHGDGGGGAGGTGSGPGGGQGGGSSSNEIMQMLMVHERRGISKLNNSSNVFSQSSKNGKINDKKANQNKKNESELKPSGEDDIVEITENGDIVPPADKIPPDYLVHINGQAMDYRKILPALIKKMSEADRQAYIEVGRRIYKKCIFD